jgi:hypothetical protein
MAHFAQLDNSNTVVQVIVIVNDELLVDGVEQESKGIEFCKSLFGQDTEWKQTSYNGTFRKNYAGYGYSYDATLDAFIPPQPFASWTLDTDSCQWNSPVPYPTDDKMYSWNEETTSWQQVEN